MVEVAGVKGIAAVGGVRDERKVEEEEREDDGGSCMKEEEEEIKTPVRWTSSSERDP